MARGGVAAPETMGVGTEKLRLLRRHGSAFAVGDALVHAQGSGLALHRQLRRLLAAHGPGVKQIERARAVSDRRDIFLIGQSGKRVFGGKARYVISRTHGLRDGSR